MNKCMSKERSSKGLIFQTFWIIIFVLQNTGGVQMAFTLLGEKCTFLGKIHKTRERK